MSDEAQNIEENEEVSAGGENDQIVEDESGLSPPTNFSLVCNIGTPSNIRIVSWCETMDLVAIVTIDNQLSIHRLNWQRLWLQQIQNDKLIVKMCWRPDGKALAVAYEDGHHSIWNVENGCELFSTVKNGLNIANLSQVTYMNWFVRSDGKRKPVKKHPDPVPSQLANLWPLENVDAPEGSLFSTPQLETNHSVTIAESTSNISSTTRLEQLEPDHMNILVICDSNGCLKLFILGIFIIAVVDLKSLLIQSFPDTIKASQTDTKSNASISFSECDTDFLQCSIISCDLSVDFSVLSAVVQWRAKDTSITWNEMGEEVPPVGRTSLVVLNTNILSIKNSEILAVAWQLILMQDLHYRIAAITEKMALEWSNCISPLAAKIRTFNRDVLVPQGTSFDAELMGAFTGGFLGNDTQSFLEVNLGYQFIRTLIMNVETTCATLENLTTQYLRPTVERLAVRVSTLLGYSKWRSVFGQLSLSSSFLNDTIETISNFIIHSNDFIPLIVHQRKLYTSFLNWILTFVGGDEIESSTTHNYPYHEILVGEFLQTCFANDKVSTFISGKFTEHLRPSSEMINKSLQQKAIQSSNNNQKKNTPNETNPVKNVVVSVELDDSLGLENEHSMEIEENQAPTSITTTVHANLDDSLGLDDSDMLLEEDLQTDNSTTSKLPQSQNTDNLVPKNPNNFDEASLSLDGSEMEIVSLSDNHDDSNNKYSTVSNNNSVPIITVDIDASLGLDTSSEYLDHPSPIKVSAQISNDSIPLSSSALTSPVRIGEQQSVFFDHPKPPTATHVKVDSIFSNHTAPPAQIKSNVSTPSGTSVSENIKSCTVLPPSLEGLVPFRELSHKSFSNLRTSIQHSHQLLSQTLMDTLSGHIHCIEEIPIFTRQELLPIAEDENAATEVFDFANLIYEMQTVYCFQFHHQPYATSTESSPFYSDINSSSMQQIGSLTFKDDQSVWILKNSLSGNHSTSSYTNNTVTEKKRLHIGVSGLECAISEETEGDNPDLTNTNSSNVLVDLKYYKNTKFMLLYKNPDQVKLGSLKKVSVENVTFYPLKLNEASASTGIINYFDEVVMMHPFHHDASECTEGQRDFDSYPAESIWLSGNRGMGLMLCTNPSRVIIMDLESDEVPDE